MNVKLLLVLLVVTPRLLALSSGVALDDLRINLEDASREIKGQKGEIEVLHDKVAALQASIDSYKQEKAEKGEAEGLELSFEKRIAQIEKNHKSILSDLKTLKTHCNECQESLAKLDAQLNGDIKTLKNSMQTMLGLLQGGKSYTVKAGDSLGKIAEENHTTTKKLKELNHLEKDQIVVGQKIMLPS